MTDFTVTIPVGPKDSHKRWLNECIQSVLNQTYPADEILLIDDQAHLLRSELPLSLEGVAALEHYDMHKTTPLPYGVQRWYASSTDLPAFSYWPTPWLSGPVVGFNYGIALAKNEWVLMLGSDDTLHPNALKFAAEEINDRLGYYNFSCHISDSDSVVTWHNNAAVVSKDLWKETGGFVPSTVTGGLDAALISIMMVHFPEHLHKVREGMPLYYVRMHEGQYTAESAGRYGTFMVQLRNDLTAEWKRPEWTR